jgi:mannosyltransferase OCH1-like enzyme
MLNFHNYFDYAYYNLFGCVNQSHDMRTKDQLNFLRVRYEHNDSSYTHAVPLIVHYVWLSRITAVDITPLPARFLYCELKHNLEILSQNKHYEHIIWTDNKIAVQSQLEFAGYQNMVEVRDVYEYQDKFPLFFTYRNYHLGQFHNHTLSKKFDYFHDLGCGWTTEDDYNPETCRLQAKYYKYHRAYSVGAEIDFLKYSIMNHTGGIMADLNAQIVSEPDLDVLKDVDFFRQSNGENGFFGSSPGNILIESVINMCAQLFDRDKDCNVQGFWKTGFDATLYKMLLEPHLNHVSAECYAEEFFIQSNVHNAFGHDSREMSMSWYNNV